jgi:CBS domain-containing protein
VERVDVIEQAEPAFRPEAGEDLATPVATLVTRPPLFVGPEATVSEAARAMHEAGTSSVLVEAEPPGIVTDRDLRSRVLAEGLPPDTPVRDVMSRPLKSFPAEDPIHGALLLMLRESIHHLPVTRGGRIVGMVTDTDLLRHQAKSPLVLLRRIEDLDGLDSPAGYALDIAGTAGTLLAGGLEPAQIGRVIASLNDALTTRLLELAEAELGPPPCSYAWIVLGSEGRREQVLLSDQDNALAYAEDTGEAASYFQALADRVVGGLLRAGFPPCPGGFMATGWCDPLPRWQERFRAWVATPDPRALLEAEVFLDFRPVHGDLSLDSLDEIFIAAGERGLFLHGLARAALTFRPPLRRFGRIRTDGGAVDLKAGGLAPIVILARLYALAARSSRRHTLERLAAASEARTLSRSGAELLAETFRTLMRLRLREQLRMLSAGEQLSNRLPLDRLSALETRRLKEAFRTIREVQETTALRFAAEGLR